MGEEGSVDFGGYQVGREGEGRGGGGGRGEGRRGGAAFVKLINWI